MRAYSSDAEDSWHLDLSTVLDRLEGDHTIYHESEAKLSKGSDYVTPSCIDWLLEELEGGVHEDYSDPEPTFTVVSYQAKIELQALLEAWADKHVDMCGMFTLIGKVTECKIEG